MADTKASAESDAAAGKEMSLIGEARKQELRESLMPWFADRFGGFYPPYGWLPLVQEIHDHLVSVAPDYRITQVKEKFGILCFYFDSNTVPPRSREACMNFVRQKERESKYICQNCSAAEASSRNKGWVATLCDDCASLDDARGYPVY